MRTKHTLLKRCTALVLSLLMIVMLLPSGAVALAADNTEILSFEQGNPVASISYKTGDAVSSSDFPAELTAVIAAAPRSFTQVKPDSAGAYTAPEDADALYEAGAAVIYSFASTGKTEYRVYGEADGVTGWYACDASGTINGKVQSVPVTWDASAVNTASAGIYTAVGDVDGYTLSCPAPEAAVTVTAKSGDENIEIHTLTWISGTPDGTDLSLTPETNTKMRVAYQIDFSKGGDEDIPAGQIEIRIPAHIFYGRDGKPADTITVPLAKAPSETGDTGFHYTIDEDTGEIVIRNYRTIEASYHFTCQIGYSFYPYQVADGYKKDDIQADFCVKGSKGELTAESQPLSVSVHTETKQPQPNKSVSRKYEVWQDSWGEKPADAADYFYVEWSLNTTIERGSQPFYITIQEDPGEYGELIGWRSTVFSKFTMCSEEELEKRTFSNDGPNTTSTSRFGSSFYVLIRYPRSMLETTTSIMNYYTAYVNGYDGDVKSKLAGCPYSYVAPDLSYQGDYCYTNKTSGWSANGGVNMLKAGKSVENYYSVSVTARGYEITNGGKDPYTTVLEDELLYMEKGRVRLDPEDYSLTGFYFSGMTEYDHEINPDSGYQAVTDEDYGNYTPVAVWIKTLDAPDEWTKYGTVTRRSKDEYLWEGVDGSTSAAGYGARVSLPEGTTKIRFTHTAARYQVSFSASLYYELHPTAHLLELIGDSSTFYLLNFSSSFAMDKDGVIRTEPRGNTYDGTFGYMIDKLDMAQYGQKVSHSSGRNYYNSLKPESSFTKKASTPVSDAAKSQETVEYTLSFNENVSYSSNIFTQQDVLDLGIIHEQRESVFYDLLPIGTMVDPDSIRAETYTFGSFGTLCEHTLETIENWRGTGRTMLKIHVTAPENVENFDRYYTANGSLRSGFTVKFKVINTWQNIGDFGSTIRNSSAYYSLDGPFAGGLADTGGNIAESEYFKDLDGDGNPPDAWENVSYADTTTKFDPLIAAEIGFKKSVKASDELHYGEKSQVPAAGTYTYQLRFANSRNVNTNNVVMFDVLESAHGRNPYWQGTLKSINTSQPQMKGIEPVIYYSTYQGFTNLTVDEHQTDLTDTSIWSTTAPADLADVTAIAIDLRYRADGTEYLFSPEEVAICYITMTAPENYWDYMDDPKTETDETAYAYNSAYLQCTSTPVYGGGGSTAVEECAPVTVSMRSPDVEIHKSSDPASGTAEQPTAVMMDAAITYHLTVTNTGKTEAIYDLKVEDVIPDGLSIQKENVQYCWGDVSSGAAPVEGAKRVSLAAEGQKLSFSVDKLDAGETLHLLIPVTVKKIGAVFENTAYLTGFNGKTWNLESETTWHKTIGGYELPDTGGFGVHTFFLVGAALVLAAGGCFAWSKRRNTKARKPSDQ